MATELEAEDYVLCCAGAGGGKGACFPCWNVYVQLPQRSELTLSSVCQGAERGMTRAASSALRYFEPRRDIVSVYFLFTLKGRRLSALRRRLSRLRRPLYGLKGIDADTAGLWRVPGHSKLSRLSIRLGCSTIRNIHITVKGPQGASSGSPAVPLHIQLYLNCSVFGDDLRHIFLVEIATTGELPAPYRMSVGQRPKRPTPTSYEENDCGMRNTSRSDWGQVRLLLVAPNIPIMNQRCAYLKNISYRPDPVPIRLRNSDQSFPVSMLSYSNTSSTRTGSCIGIAGSVFTGKV
ncbi:hypothetical protein EDB19DRAFT_1834800 [Suillus lakei]|nr:hypothetical protein EDB19DRAFT_1834800 [Suillus lakei]